MDNTKMLKNLSIVCNALNQIDVRGKQNLMNLSGSIDVLETIIESLKNEMEENTAEEME